MLTKDMCFGGVAYCLAKNEVGQPGNDAGAQRAEDKEQELQNKEGNNSPVDIS